MKTLILLIIHGLIYDFIKLITIKLIKFIINHKKNSKQD